MCDGSEGECGRNDLNCVAVGRLGMAGLLVVDVLFAAAVVELDGRAAWVALAAAAADAEAVVAVD